MTQQKPAGSPASKHIPFIDRLARWGRVTAFLLTAGFMYPNVMVEGMDLTKIQAETEGDLYEKK